MHDEEQQIPLTGAGNHASPSPRDSVGSARNQGRKTSFQWCGVKKIWDGPTHPRDLQVTLFFKSWQLYPEILAKRIPYSLRVLFLLALWVSWFVCNIVLARHGVLAISYDRTVYDDKALEMHNTIVPPLGCGLNQDYWIGPGNKCGLDGADCIENVVGTTLTFKCPPDCGSNGWTYEPWTVGAQSLMRQTVIIGGPEIYRGDSFICGAAVHAGIISKHTGGFGRLEWIGSHPNFESVVSRDGRFNSTSFNSEFPLNFKFTSGNGVILDVTNRKDLRNIHIAVNIAFMLLAAYFIPTADSSVIYLCTMATFGFWTVILASNPPSKGGNPEANAELISLGFRRLLPCFLGLVFTYVFAVKPQLEHMHASLSRCIFWGGGFIIGILENYVFGSIPIDRLMVSDLNSQPGAWAALAILCGIIFVIVIGQAYSFWLKGDFRRYFKAYIAMIFALVMLGIWPGQTLRLHHYFFALLLLPGTSLKTTCSLFYQGLLLGLYIAGVARWDFDSILQTAAQLSRGAALPSETEGPSFIDPVAEESKGLMIQWQQEYTDDSFNSFSLLINDIERVRVTEEESSVGQVVSNGVEMTKYAFNLTSWITDHFSQDATPRKWYIRVAGAILGNRHSVNFGTYSPALTINEDGTFELSQ